LLQRIASIQPEAALSIVGIRPDNLQATPDRILADRFGLILGRVFLMIRGHADVFGRAGRAPQVCIL
jgi:hypothetical protein